MSNDDKTVILGMNTKAAPGMRLNGIYEIDRLIGAGGMSEIYRAHNVQTMETVAVKVILPQFAKDEQIISLFRREALILNRLNHEAIIRYHVFSHDPVVDLLYLAMEYVEGPTLRERMATRTLSQMEACQLVAQVAAGMKVAHDEGVIHRDLSSDNIILANGDVAKPKVIDFGIARAGDANDSTLIETGFAGKYNYVSPEQLGLFGGVISPASDIYSLGLVFAAALRGKPIDMSGTHADVVMKRQSLPDLSTFNPGVRPLIEKMLQPNPAQRLKSMDQVIAELERIFGPRLNPKTNTKMKPLAGSVPVASTSKSKRGPRFIMPLFLVIAAAAAGWGASHINFADISRLLAPSDPARSPAEAAGAAEHENNGKEQIRAHLDNQDTGKPAAAATPEAPDLPSLGEAAVPVEHAPAAGAGAQLNDDGEELAAVPEANDASPDRPRPPRIDLNESGPTASASDATRPLAPQAQSSLAPAQAVTLPAASLAQWLRGFDGGECFYARPTTIAAKAAGIEGFARSVKPLERMEKDYRARFGQDPTIRMRPLAANQCGALEIVRNGPSNLQLAISRDLIRDGETISATVSNIVLPHVAIFLVGPNGAVSNVTARAKATGRDVTLDLPSMDVKSSETGYLILVVSADEPLGALDATAPKSADKLIQQLQDQAQTRSAQIDANIVYFRRQ